MKKITVTQEHIDNGRRGCRTTCGIGLAIAAVTGEWSHSVNPVTIRLFGISPNPGYVPAPVEKYECSDKLRSWIHAFDEATRSACEPIVVVLESGKAYIEGEIS